MRALEAHKVDAFTTTPFSGNPAGVVPDARGLSDDQMQAIAREMNVSETAFLLPAARGDAQMRLRYFTPRAEIPLCGHATIATFHLLAEQGRVKTPAVVALETGAGVLRVEIRAGGEVFLESGPLSFAKSPLDAPTLSALLGIPRAEIDDADQPLLVVDAKLFVPLAGLKTMERLRPDLRAIALASRDARLQGIVPVSHETFHRHARTHIRFFAPAIGIDEDPVTGTAHMGLAAYLLRARRLSLAGGRAAFLGEQGDFVGRPGLVSVEIEGSVEDPRVRVGGRGFTTFSGQMRVP